METKIFIENVWMDTQNCLACIFNIEKDIKQSKIRVDYFHGVDSYQLYQVGGLEKIEDEEFKKIQREIVDKLEKIHEDMAREIVLVKEETKI